MDAIYIIVKNEHGNPKLPLRWGIMGNGLHGYCLYNGQIVCFKSFNDADMTRMSFTNPHLFDVVEYRKCEIVHDERNPPCNS